MKGPEPQDVIRLWDFVNRNGVEVPSTKVAATDHVLAARADGKNFLIRDENRKLSPSGRVLGVWREPSQTELAANSPLRLSTIQAAMFDSKSGLLLDIFGSPMLQAYISGGVNQQVFQTIAKALMTGNPKLLIQETRRLAGTFY